MFILSFSDDFCTVDCVNILQAGMTHVSIFVLFYFFLKIISHLKYPQRLQYHSLPINFGFPRSWNLNVPRLFT